METTPRANEKPNISAHNGATLAYLGDAVLELWVRRHLLETGIENPGKLSAMARGLVRASAQSAGVEALLSHLTEEEEAIYRRGRNGAGAHPRSASAIEYRRATGFEAVLGYLYLSGDEARISALCDIYFADRQKDAGGGV